jgi:colanic acid/amylovoran biosynthesis protein
MRIYLSGHNALWNRGCEAIVRGTADVVRSLAPGSEVLVPSIDVDRDREQWPDAREWGVSFVPWTPSPLTRVWVHAQRLPIRTLKRAGWPFGVPADLRERLRSVDLVLSIGGDNYTLDYLLPTPILGVDQAALDLGVPVVLWGASVGPFEREPDFVPVVRDHLRRMALITVREPVTLDYLTGTLGLSRAQVFLGADPAFRMLPEPFALEGILPDSPNGVLGFNLSPLMERFRGAGSRGDLTCEAAAFVREVVVGSEMGVVLVPHVIPYEPRMRRHCDHHYLERVRSVAIEQYGVPPAKVTLLPPNLNAARIKHVIAACRAFIGARMHSTIAAFSTGVPTGSIAYSPKAVGMNVRLFGHDRFVVSSRELSSLALLELFEAVMTAESEQRVALRREAADAVRAVEDMLNAGVASIGRGSPTATAGTRSRADETLMEETHG